MPSEEVCLPVWVNNDCIEKILQKDDTNLKVVNVEIENACGKGDNYASKIIKIHVDVKCKKIADRKSYLLKYLEDGMMAKFFTENGMFEREIEMYKNTIPMFRELYEKFFPGEKVAPHTSYLKIDGNKMLFMKDLSVEGYRMGNRLTGLDLDHCMMVMKKLGQFHALGALLLQQKPLVFEAYKHHIFYMKTCEHYYMSLLRSFALEVEHWPEYRHLVSKLNKLADHFKSLGSKATEHKAGEFLVLNHGDLWTTNILFNYNQTGKVSDAIFVDYQLVYYGSPVYDLIYFFATSLTEDIYENNIPLLIKTYHKSLSENLTKINYSKQIPTLENIQQEFKEKEIILAYCLFTNYPVARCHSSDNFQFEERIFKNINYKDKRDKIFQRETTKIALQNRLKQFENSGFFDHI